MKPKMRAHEVRQALGEIRRGRALAYTHAQLARIAEALVERLEAVESWSLPALPAPSSGQSELEAWRQEAERIVSELRDADPGATVVLAHQLCETAPAVLAAARIRFAAAAGDTK